MASMDKENAAISDRRDLTAIEKEAKIVQAQQPLDEKDVELAVQDAEVNPELPLSKAKAITLVVTVTAASILNVC